jgi:hypothetical protein
MFIEMLRNAACLGVVIGLAALFPATDCAALTPTPTPEFTLEITSPADGSYHRGGTSGADAIVVEGRADGPLGPDHDINLSIRSNEWFLQIVDSFDQTTGIFRGRIWLGGEESYCCQNTLRAILKESATGAELARKEITLHRTCCPTYQIRFSDYNWVVKTVTGYAAGPGPNYFARNNVWIDSQDRLHLRIAEDGGRWRCGEVFLRESFGYSTVKTSSHATS